MKKFILTVTLLVGLGTVAFAKQYVKNGKYMVDATNRVAEDCRALISKGYHIDCVTIDVENGRFIIIYSDKE